MAVLRLRVMIAPRVYGTTLGVTLSTCRDFALELVDGRGVPQYGPAQTRRARHYERRHSPVTELPGTALRRPAEGLHDRAGARYAGRARGSTSRHYRVPWFHFARSTHRAPLRYQSPA